MLRLIWQEIKFRRNGIIGWSLGLCFFPLVYISIYPSVADQMAGFSDLEIYKAMGMAFDTFPDWVGSILIIFMPLVAAIYGVINGTGTLAGEEEDGRLEMVVTLPLPRWQIVVAKAAALITATLIMYLVVAVVSTLVFVSIEGQIETEMAAADMFKTVMSTWPLLFAMAMLSLFLSAFTSRRRVGAIIAAIVLVLGYFGSNAAGFTSALEPFEPFFLFSYLDASGKAVMEGQAAGDVLVFVILGLVSFALALFFFERRDLTVGAWPWQRGQVEA